MFIPAKFQFFELFQHLHRFKYYYTSIAKAKDKEPLKTRGKNWNEADSLKLIDAYQYTMTETKKGSTYCASSKF